MDKNEIINHSKSFKQFWALMTFSFPKIERRECEDFISKSKNPLFAIEAAFNNTSDIEYFITNWTLNNFVYIEHFALSEKLRGKGIGSSVFNDFIKKSNRPIVLEVEPPTDIISRKRIRFYERLGFTLFHWEYQQPPYRASDNFLDLLLMTNSPELLKSDDRFQQVKAEIYRHVYDIEIK